MVPGFSQQAWRNPADRHRHRDSPFLVHRVASGVGPHVYGLPAPPPPPPPPHLHFTPYMKVGQFYFQCVHSSI